MMNNIFLRAKDAQQVTALARSTFYAYIAQGLLPPPIKLGVRASAWLSSELAAVNRARIFGQSNDEIKTLVQELVAARNQKEVSHD